MELTEIGTVISPFKEPADPFKMKKEKSCIEIYPQFADGLLRLEESEYIHVIFGFHLSEGYTLQHNNYWGEFKGVFAACSPRRPSPLGLTAVRLLGIEENILRVQGLDAVHGSPVFDLKPYIPLSEGDRRQGLAVRDQ